VSFSYVNGLVTITTGAQSTKRKLTVSITA